MVTETDDEIVNIKIVIIFILKYFEHNEYTNTALCRIFYDTENRHV